MGSLIQLPGCAGTRWHNSGTDRGSGKGCSEEAVYVGQSGLLALLNHNPDSNPKSASAICRSFAIVKLRCPLRRAHVLGAKTGGFRLCAC
eukprot:4238069-Amphidinium_carterae.1